MSHPSGRPRASEQDRARSISGILALKDTARLHQGSPAPARQDTHRGRPPQLPGGAGCIQSVLVQEMNIWVVAYLFHSLEV